MQIATYCAIPVISALIGWFTNFLAVKMIFRPRREIRFLWFRIMGLLPKRKLELAEKIAETVEKELISNKDIHAIIQSEDFHNQTGKVIKSRIGHFIDEKITSNTLLMMLVSPEVVSRLTDALMEELQKEIPGTIDSLFETVESRLDFRKIVYDKIKDFEVSKLESIVFSIASRELKAIEYLGGVLGFLIGLVQVGMIIAGDIKA
ncbi:MAG: DUF445 family protein [Fibrobacter sp.]|jgi:uncharacterized membrane protein YheB (UPF0754 family)|nr:DUF445 family protein [Fibrobacter sp.]